MTLRDQHGLALSTANAASVVAYDRAIELFNGFRRDPLAVIGQALEQDPDFVSGHLARAALVLGSFDPMLVTMAGQCLDVASACRASSNDRERSLHGALRAWVKEGIEAGNRALDRHVIDHPRDMLAIQLAHLSDLMLGRTAMLRDRIARVLQKWDQDESGYPYLQAMLAFGLEENGSYGQAEALGRHALERQPDCTWAVHAVAHVYEMSDRTEAGLQWLEHTRARWQNQNILSVHNHWHLALFRLEHDGADAAMALYDEAIAPTAESLAMNLSDATALLWRLTLKGADAGWRWSALAERWLQRPAWGRTAFTDLHAALCMAVIGSDEQSQALAEAMRRGAPGQGTATAWSSIVLPAQRAFIDFVAGEYRACADRLLPLLPQAHAVGGSHAQRELLLLTARCAAAHCGDTALADALGGQLLQTRRLAHRSLSKDTQAWSRAEALAEVAMVV